ncbi:MAG: hydrolase [Deltaproteobacteria bacterium]|nr:hydrolase [Deltaproteobacteria bacterium]
MFIEEVNQLLEPGYLPFETGNQRLANGHIYIAVLTRMPQCKGKMVNWWFGYAGDTEKYRMWHPKDHIIGDWDDKWRPGHYIGASHLVHEYIGGELVKLKITFREPSEFFDPSKFKEAKVGAAICGDVGLLEEGIKIGNLIHFVRDTDFGCEMRSRFWLFGADEKIGRTLMQHCIEEMGNLADLLPGLYARETGNQ